VSIALLAGDRVARRRRSGKAVTEWVSSDGRSFPGIDDVGGLGKTWRAGDTHVHDL
jgi:hypothetical protein